MIKPLDLKPSFSDLCKILPAGVSWGESLDPEIARAIYLAGQANPPDGWKLVPTNPTDQMLRSGSGAYGNGYEAVFDAMLDAAPTPGKDKE